MASPDGAFIDHVLDLLQAFGPVRAKKMFGGYGVFLDDLVFAIVADDVLYFKADADNAHQFDALDLPPFAYLRNGKEVRMSYRQAPEAALDDSAEMQRWAESGRAAALRAARKKSR